MSVEVVQPVPRVTLSGMRSRTVVQLERALPGSRWRTGTLESHQEAVQRVILAMRERLDEPLSLQDMAEIALLSPYHFNRVFRFITGLPPCRFLAALRMEAAKRLLLTTQRSVTEVCYDVGYNSLGTFTTHFAHSIGVPPSRLRHLRNAVSMPDPELFRERAADPLHVVPQRPSITGNIRVANSFAGAIYVGLFPSPIPAGRPVGCTLLPTPGPFRLGPVPDGRYYLFAASLPCREDPGGFLLPDTALRGSQSPIQVRGRQVPARADVMLRSALPTDPPILVALPFLILNSFAAARLAVP